MRFLISVFLAISCATASEGAEKNKYKRAVQEAHNLLLQRQRAESLAILVEEIKLHTDPSVKRALLVEIKQASELFFTDKGQKLYAMAEAKRLRGEADALAKYNEARSTEGDNGLVLRGLVLVHLERNECNKSDPLLQILASIDPEAETNRYLQLVQRNCKEANSLTQEDLAAVQQMKELKKFGLAVYASSLCGSKKWSECASVAKQIVSEDELYPSGYYWMWKSASEESGEGMDEAQKFLSLCHTISVMIKAKYQWDPYLCHDKIAPEKYLKSKEGKI